MVKLPKMVVDRELKLTKFPHMYYDKTTKQSSEFS